MRAFLRAIASRLGRRGVAILLAGLAAVILLAPFLTGRKQIDQGGISSPTPAAPAFLSVFTYPGYFADDVLKEFESSSGMAVRYETFETVEEMRAKVVSDPGAYDLIIADDGSAEDLRKLKLIEPFQPRLLPGLEHLDPRFFSHSKGGAQVPDPIFVPFLGGSTIAAYRTDKLDLREEDKSWSLFWDERVRDKAALSNEPSDVFAVALASLGMPLHSKEVPHHQQAVARLQTAIRDNGVKLGGAWTNLEQLVSGEFWLVHCYSGDAALFAEKNENIGYFLPKEGAELWMDGFLLCRDSKNTEAAHRFVAFMLRPDIAARCANFAWYLSPNLAARPKLDPELLADPVLNPSPETLQRCSLVQPDHEWLSLLQFGMRELQQALDSREAFPTAAPRLSASVSP